jgi:hypothetical protein
VKPEYQSFRLGIVLVEHRQHADPGHATDLLRPSRNRPRCRAAEPGNELTPSHL